MLDLEEILEDMTTELVQLEKYEPFLGQLFSQPAGEWMAVTTLHHDLAKRLADDEETTAGYLQVTWLDYPDSQYGTGYCAIVFFHEPLHWHNLAIYNRQQFLTTAADSARIAVAA